MNKSLRAKIRAKYLDIPSNKILSFRIHPRILERVKKYAYKKGWSVSKVINVTLKLGLDVTIDERDLIPFKKKTVIDKGTS